MPDDLSSAAAAFHSGARLLQWPHLREKRISADRESAEPTLSCRDATGSVDRSRRCCAQCFTHRGRPQVQAGTARSRRRWHAPRREELDSGEGLRSDEVLEGVGCESNHCSRRISDLRLTGPRGSRTVAVVERLEVHAAAATSRDAEEEREREHDHLAEASHLGKQ